MTQSHNHLPVLQIQICRNLGDFGQDIIIEPEVWCGANEDFENAVKRNKEEHKHCFNNQKVWSVPILDPGFVDGNGGK